MYGFCSPKVFSAGVDRLYVLIFLMVDLVFGQISDSSHNASGSLNNFFLFFGVLGDDFEEYKGITTLYQEPFYFIFSLFSAT